MEDIHDSISVMFYFLFALGLTSSSTADIPV